MSPEKENHILKAYPMLYRATALAPQDTCMVWGIAVGDGWFGIVNEASACLAEYAELRKAAGNLDFYKEFRMEQVKEKFGGLRMYTSITDDIVEAIIGYAEFRAYRTCESCGSTEGVTQTKGWIKTLCKNCMSARK